jgi:hypothetical protein
MFCLLHLYTARLPYELTWKSILDRSLYCDILLCSFVTTRVFLQAPRNKDRWSVVATMSLAVCFALRFYCTIILLTVN